MNILDQPEDDVRSQIKQYLIRKGIMKKWLADQIKISTTHLSKVLDCERPLTKDNLQKINNALETGFIQKQQAPTSAS